MSDRRRSLRTSWLLTLMALTFACSDDIVPPTPDPEGPVPSAVAVVLVGDSAVGGVVLQLAVPDSISVVPADSTHRFFSADIDGGRRIALFARSLEPGALARFVIPDSTRLDEYAVTLEQVTRTDNSAVTDLSGFSLTLDPYEP